MILYRQFERKWEDGNWSDHESDVDESVQVARADVSADGRSFCSVADPPIVKDDDVEVEYTDELGRTRTGTRREAREAETARRREQGSSAGPVPGFKSAHEDVMQSNVICESLRYVREASLNSLRDRRTSIFLPRIRTLEGGSNRADQGSRVRNDGDAL